MNAYSYGLIGFMASFAVGRKGVTQDEVDAWVAELRELEKQGKYFFSLNRYMFVVVKPGAP
jgi:arsenite methyltransferase